MRSWETTPSPTNASRKACDNETVHFLRCVVIIAELGSQTACRVSKNPWCRTVQSPPPTDWTQIRSEVLARDNHTCMECGIQCRSADTDVHHLLPRSAGGTDDPSNLVTLCDGCHAAHHPKLAGKLARRVIERWAVRLALWLDRQGTIAEASGNLGEALRLFGLRRFRDGQMPIVQAALSGKSVLVVSPTGSGKTLCFQLPAVLRPGVSVVVSPLKALMGEQVSALLRRKIPSTFINSDLDQGEKALRYGLLLKGTFKLLYAAPERFFVRNRSELDALRSIRPSFMVIDEAHCVDQWGNDFRPEYGRLGEVRKALGSPPILAFTATAGREMQGRIMHSLGISDAHVFVRGVDRPNISLLRWQAPSDLRPELIAQLCRTQLPSDGKLMIFVPTRKIGEALQRYLDGLGLNTPFYHSHFGTAWEREQLVKRFSGQSMPVVNRIICTSAFGMGLDIPNVRMVVHWQQPSSVEDYLQEFGRAGRDGLPSVAIIFHGDRTKDIGLLNFMAEKTAESSQADPTTQALALTHKRRQISNLQSLLDQEDCFRQVLVSYFSGSKQKTRKSFSVWLLEWIFSDREKVSKKVPCCDACCQKTIKRRGQLAYVQELLIAR
jgi:ATP-dependent DNA helicase RecQ